MGWLTTIFELPQFFSYMFLPTLTEEERENQNIPLYVLVFFIGIVVGMATLAAYILIRPLLPF